LFNENLYLLAQKQTLIESLKTQSADMNNLVKPIEAGDEADVASDAVDRALTKGRTPLTADSAATSALTL